jgi:hypothetical protein
MSFLEEIITSLLKLGKDVKITVEVVKQVLLDLLGSIAQVVSPLIDVTYLLSICLAIRTWRMEKLTRKEFIEKVVVW